MNEAQDLRMRERPSKGRHEHKSCRQRSSGSRSCHGRNRTSARSSVATVADLALRAADRSILSLVLRIDFDR